MDSPLPLMTPQEVAVLLRTSKGAVYKMHERRQLPGAVRLGRRLLFDRAQLVEWVCQNRAPSLKGVQ